VFWAAETDEELSRDLQELHRSDEMLQRRAHQAPARDEAALVSDERRRRNKAQEEVRRRLRDALLAGSVFFRGNDRSPSENARELRPEVEALLERVLPDVFDRFEEGAARVRPVHLEALLSADNLHGLPSVFADLKLVVTRQGQDVFNTESGPLAEILGRITNRAEYGDPTSGKALAEHFGKEPYGWDFDVVRLMTASLLRAGKVELRSQNQTIESVQTLEAKNVLTNNNRFRQATLRPREGPKSTDLVDASVHFEALFGRAVPELEAGVIARELRGEMAPLAERLRRMVGRLSRERLAGQEPLQAAQAVASELQSASDVQAVRAFNTGHKTLEHGLERLRQLEDHLHDAALEQIRAARRAVEAEWPALEADGFADGTLQDSVDAIADILSKETLYKELPAVATAAAQVQQAYEARLAEAAAERAGAYGAALEKLEATPRWQELEEGLQAEIATPLRARASQEGSGLSLAMLRENALACPGILRNAVERVLQLSATDAEPEVVIVSDLVRGLITSEEQLDAALVQIHDRCLKSIVDGASVILA
jgi:hypothetical protein